MKKRKTMLNQQQKSLPVSTQLLVHIPWSPRLGTLLSFYVSHWRIRSSERTTNDGICYYWSLIQTLIGIPFPCNLSLQNSFPSNPFWTVFRRAFCKPVSSIALEVWAWLAGRCHLLPAAVAAWSQMSPSGGQTCREGSGSGANPNSFCRTVKDFPILCLAQVYAPPRP